MCPIIAPRLHADATPGPMPPSVPAGRANLDVVGVALSCACACHCAALPLLVAAMPALGVLLGAQVEWALVALAAAVGGTSLLLHVTRAPREARVRVAAPFVVALGLLLAARVAESAEWGRLAEVGGPLAAGSLAIAHLTATGRTRREDVPPAAHERGDDCCPSC